MSVAKNEPLSLPTTSDDGQKPLLSSTISNNIAEDNEMDKITVDDHYSMPTIFGKDLENQTMNIISDSPKIELIRTNSTKNDNKNDDNFCCESSFKYRIRYGILLLTVMCLTFTRSNELSFNFTVICMNSNSTTGQKEQPITMTTDEISTIMASGGFGALLSVLPMGYLLHQAGPRLVFGILLLFSGLATISLGPLAKQAPLWMLGGRIIQGLALSTVMPMTGAVSAEWASIKEVGKFVTMLSAAGQLSQILTMPLSAYLCVENGWSSVYTAHGLLSIIGSGLFMFLYNNSAKKHPFVTNKEYQIITHDAQNRPKRGSTVPYMKIIKSKPVWAVWIAFLGNAIAFQLIVQFMPTFLNKALHITVKRTGIYAIIPPITQLIIKIIAGYASDKINLPEKLKLQLFNSAAQIGCAICLLPLGFINIGNGTFAIICFSSSISFLGLVSCGSMKSATLIGRSYTHLIMTIVQLIVCISMLIVPFMVAILAPNNTVEEWKFVFITVFIILVITNTIFCSLCSAEPESWAVVQKKILH